MFSRFCRLVLKLFGWKVDATFPESGKYVMIIAPHTSNWDFPIGMLAAKILKLDVHYLGKHTLFEGPFGWLFRMLGGIPVYRDEVRNVSQQMADRFNESERLVLCIAPEGTRSRTEYWKMGFWHIASAARVPIAMAYIDYPSKTVGGGEHFMPGEDMETDLQRIRDFFRGRQGRHPENQGPIRARPTGDST